MIKKVFLLLSVFLGMTTLSAQNLEKENKLVGVWQLCNMTDIGFGSSPKMERVPYLKVFSPKGALTNLMISPKGEVFLTMEGSYDLKSDTTYIEHIGKLLVSSAMDGRDNEMTYEFLDDNVLMITFQIVDNEGNTLNCQEVWERVVMPDRD